MLIMYYLCIDLYVVCLVRYALQFGGNKDIYIFHIKFDDKHSILTDT